MAMNRPAAQMPVDLGNRLDAAGRAFKKDALTRRVLQGIVREALELGVPGRTIAKSAGISPTTVDTWKREMGITTKRQ